MKQFINRFCVQLLQWPKILLPLFFFLFQIYAVSITIRIVVSFHSVIGLLELYYMEVLYVQTKIVTSHWQLNLYNSWGLCYSLHSGSSTSLLLWS